MLNMPILKFEKSCTYLKEQLEIQENVKQLLGDMTPEMYDLIVVGMGPSSVFCAYELVQLKK